MDVCEAKQRSPLPIGASFFGVERRGHDEQPCRAKMRLQAGSGCVRGTLLDYRRLTLRCANGVTKVKHAICDKKAVFKILTKRRALEGFDKKPDPAKTRRTALNREACLKAVRVGNSIYDLKNMHE